MYFYNQFIDVAAIYLICVILDTLCNCSCFFLTAGYMKPCQLSPLLADIMGTEKVYSVCCL